MAAKIRSSKISGAGSAFLTAVVSYPDVVLAGDRITVGFSPGGSTTHTWPGGWIPGPSQTNNNNIQQDIRYRIADGSEGGTTFPIILSAAMRWQAQAIAIYDFDPNKAPEFAILQANSANPNPPALSPSWGLADTLWVSWMTWAGTITPTGFPAGFTGLGWSQSQGGVNQATISTDYLQQLASTIDPGPYTSPSARWISAVMAMAPAPPPPVDTGDNQAMMRLGPDRIQTVAPNNVYRTLASPKRRAIA